MTSAPRPHTSSSIRFSWIRGKHSFKFGFDYRWNGLNWRDDSGPGQFNFGADVTGLPNFNQTGHGFASMLLGQVTERQRSDRHSGRLAIPDVLRRFCAGRLEGRPRLTLNLGLRWDYQPQGTEKYDRLHNFNPSSSIRSTTSRARSSLRETVRAATASATSMTIA